MVIAIIALLLSILTPALGRAKDVAKSVICRTHLKTLGMANKIYASDWEWYVPAIDSTMVVAGQPTWISNEEFKSIVGLNDKDLDEDLSVGYKMPEDYLCPSDEKINYESGVSFQNEVSYGYNLTDWGTNSVDNAIAKISPFIIQSSWACRLKDGGQIETPSKKIMFVDAGDIWVRRSYANYKEAWDKYGQDRMAYRINSLWHVTFYRHNESADIVFFDGHAEQVKKRDLFQYQSNGVTPDSVRNNRRWFCDPANIRRSAPNRIDVTSLH